MRKLKSISLGIPETLQPVTDEDDYAPRKIKQWVADLPMGHRGETTKLLLRHLRHFNAVDLPVDDRFEIMQTLAVPVEQTIHALQHHLFNQTLPLTERTILVAEVSNDLLANMIIGYRLILNAGKKKNWLYQQVQQRMWLVSLYQMLRYFERILCVHRMLHFGRPKGLWHGVHNLYLETRKANWHRTPVELANGISARSTIENEYKKALLVALISRHQVRGDQYDHEIIPLLAHWADKTELRPAGSGADTAITYCITPDADMPPMAMDTKLKLECGGTPNGVVFDTAALRRYMLELLRGSDDSVLVANHRVSKDTLELLFGSWCQPHVRKEPRHKGSGTLAITLGLSHTNHIVASRYEEHDPKQVEPDTVTLESLRSALAPLFEQHGEPEPQQEAAFEFTDIVYKKDAAPRSAWAEFSRRNGWAPLQAQIVNESKHGYCLSVTPPESEHVRHGDVIGVYEAAKDQWNLGQLVWMKGEPAHEILLGLQVIATAVLPVRMRVILGFEQHSEALPALVGHDAQDDLLIVMPYLPAARQKRFVIDYFGHCAYVDMPQRVAITPSFIAYKLALGMEEEPVQPKVIDLPYASRPVLHKPPRPEPLAPLRGPARHDDNDEYADLWDKL